jgi:hypothetical protein
MLEYNVCIFTCQQVHCSGFSIFLVRRLQLSTLCLSRRGVGSSYCISCGSVPLLLALNFLQPSIRPINDRNRGKSSGDWNSPEELLPIHLIQLAHDVLDRIVQPWYNNVLDGIYSSIGSADDFIEDSECCL